MGNTTTTATTSEAGRAVAANALENRRRLAREGGYNHNVPPISAEQATAEIAPLFPEKLGKVELAQLPEPPAVPIEKKPSARKFSLQTTIAYRGREITIVAEGMTLDEFCDLMDSRHYASPAPLALAAPIATADDLPDGYKLCQKHRAPMRPRNKQNDNWHSHNVGTAEKPLWCKGYRGSDSPGYEVE